MLKIGLTGGIASGKSLSARYLQSLGAVLIDADELARAVVAPGSKGLAAVVQRFGPGVLGPDGALYRAALGALIFADSSERDALNAIIHPLVRARAAELVQAAAADDDNAVVVQDIPLLVETGQGSSFHLVLVVDAPVELQIARIVAHRGLNEADAAARIAAQAPRGDRLAAADAVIDNSGTVEGTLRQMDRLWEQRLLPFVDNLRHGRVAGRAGPAVLVPPNPLWQTQAARLSARIAAAAPGEVLAVDHIGSTAVPGLPAKDVLDLQVRVRSLAAADRLAPALAAAGFPRLPGVLHDTPHAPFLDLAQWQKRLHASADPGRAANVHVRVEGSAGALFALAFRDWLRAEPAACAEYLSIKRGAAAQHSADLGTGGYAVAKEPWFRDVAFPAVSRWTAAMEWTPPLDHFPLP
ncbi:dephospho-CoA kinase [Arthrobacter sp. H14-L1]|uniref:dephospho-CoA kinase n=1 Tax=Arthrobacter sp. H14-L1 TaxID=2996697 RepID=UPI00226E9A99|nr:dephospho-CoA kinase [Arthrobacter sp. H14-L1]MCY0905237.1 dephospho-CoA kinase [Arthrobacter sp. H14-L1]